MGSKIIVLVVSLVVSVALFPFISEFIDPMTAAPSSTVISNEASTSISQIAAGTYYGTTTGSLLDVLPVLVVLVLVAGTAAFVFLRKKGA